MQQMRFAMAAAGLIMLSSSSLPAAEPRVLSKVTPLPVALDPDFQFRKTKLYYLSETGQQGSPSRVSSIAPSSKGSTVQDASISFERQYRMHGAVTGLDQRQRFGDYFDFFWRARRDASVSVRLEYRQEKLHEHVQAQEISYANARGTHKTEFKIVGDDYFDDGRVIAWRCLLIENGRIVAQHRSFAWE